MTDTQAKQINENRAAKEAVFDDMPEEESEVEETNMLQAPDGETPEATAE